MDIDLEKMREDLRIEMIKAFIDALEIRDFYSAFTVLLSLSEMSEGDMEGATEHMSGWEAEPERGVKP
ncbi:MAG: hypothetical protein KJ731_21125 [Alphaproteobacteria bacterium]|uniref:Uncharacterized protein n=1 Tax=viral metagenome TaxID=1070528 RepID=A0A6M3JKT8_9ZZZZ|nr:hypothetical protein [Alphaproteobacteria bacterium]MBU1280289.1 hypothetical protein [Alphaproteobacteria bacterium]MBU1573028.1 hypothetical protein [Alphaproteobacteria bacterium]MBU1830954.1 hypothetical protein [Alphaproteobacteria bacterium]MBU2079987.1 hypothetical protein [Alphaproteobacteria bacterium]